MHPGAPDSGHSVNRQTKSDPSAGHEPAETDDRSFAPVTRGADHRGRTTPDPPERDDDGREPSSGTGVAGQVTRHPDALPPDEQGVEQAERHDASREHESGGEEHFQR